MAGCPNGAQGNPCRSQCIMTSSNCTMGCTQ
jgi:hypothetical protein